MREQIQADETEFFDGEEVVEDEDAEYLATQSEAGEDSIRPEFRDLSLKEEAGEKLAFHEDIDASSVSLEVRNGIVTLMGSVASEREKLEAADCLFDLDDVIDVINDLDVR